MKREIVVEIEATPCFCRRACSQIDQSFQSDLHAQVYSIKTSIYRCKAFGNVDLTERPGEYWGKKQFIRLQKCINNEARRNNVDICDECNKPIRGRAVLLADFVLHAACSRALERVAKRAEKQSGKAGN